MRAFISATKRFFAQIWSDAMLIVLLFAPLIMGLAFCFGVPVLEGYLCERLGRTELLAPYYPIFDLLLSIMTPVMFTSAGAMVILDEADSGIAMTFAVTPVGRSGYLSSRIVVPSFLATVYCVIVSLIFKLSDMGTLTLIMLALCSGALSVTVALMISTLAKNKVEGLAYSKLSGLFVLGLPIALLVPAPFKYACAFLPTFWMTEIVLGGGLWLVVPAIATSVLFSVIFARYFIKKILH